MLHVQLNTTIPKNCQLAAAELDQQTAYLLQEIGQTVLSLQQLDFEKKSRGGTSVDGTQWKPLAESTERRKAAKKGGKKGPTSRKGKSGAGAAPKSQIGIDTGVMRNCVTPGYRAPDGDGGNVFDLNRSEVTVGYSREYAPWFDEGTERQPARPLMPNQMPDPWRQKVDRVVEDWLKDIARDLER